MKHLILGLLLVVAPKVFSSEGGVHGGGHVIEVNGKLELVDLVTKATCDTRSGTEMMIDNPVITEILAKVENLDWYLALDLEKEIKDLSWCLTGKLYLVPAADDDSFVQQLTEGVQQAAFRYNRMAYIDNDIFKSLSNNSRAYLIFHETLHSYLPMNLAARRFDLQTLVATFQKVHKGQIKTRDSLHRNLKMAEMNFPFNVRKLNPFKKTLQFILGNGDSQIETILSEANPEVLINPNVTRVADYVASWDKNIVKDPGQVLASVVAKILLSEDLENAKAVLNKNFTSLNPVLIGLSVYDDLDPAVQSELVHSHYIQTTTVDVVNFIKSIVVKVSNSRILGDLKLQSLTEDSQKKTPFYLTSLNVGEKFDLPAAIDGMTEYIVLMINLGNISVLESTIFSNEDLISALKMEKLKGDISKLDTPSDREKGLALTKVERIQKSMVKKIASEIELKLSPENFELVKPFINKL